MSGSNEGRKRYNSETLLTAILGGTRWGGDETAYLEEHLQNHTFDTAITLSRSYEAVQTKRQNLELRRLNYMKRGQRNNKPQAEPMTLKEACLKRDELKKQGVTYAIITPIYGTDKYQVAEGRAAKEG